METKHKYSASEKPEKSQNHSRNSSFVIQSTGNYSTQFSKTRSFNCVTPDPIYKFPVITLEKPSRFLTDYSSFTLADTVDMKQTFSYFHQKSPFQRTGRSNLPSDASSYISSYKNTLEMSSSYLKSPRLHDSSKRASLASEFSIGNTYLVNLNMDTGLSFSTVKSDEVVFNPCVEEMSGIQWEEREILSYDEVQVTDERNSEVFVQLLEEDDVEDSRNLYNSIDALRKANLIDEDEPDSVNEEGSIRFSAANRLFLSGQTASKDKLVEIDSFRKGTARKTKLETVCPDLNSPIVRKVVVFEENEDSQIVETRDSRNEIKALQILFSVAAVGFSSSPLIEFSNVKLKSRGHASNMPGTSPLVSLFSSKVLKQVKNLNVVLVSCGYEHAAILTVDGKVLTWGYGASGCLGQESKKSYSHPAAINSIFNKSIKYLECGAYHTVAVSDSGEVYTWGRGDVQQLGLPSEKMLKDEIGSCVLRPTKVKWIKDAVSIACGEAHTLILLKNGTVFAFGWNEDGQLGLESCKNSQVRLPKKIVKISAGALFSAALSESGKVFVWGSGEQGQLGLGNNVKSSKIPAKVKGVKDIVDVVCGENSVLAIDKTGKVFAWGQGTVSFFSDPQHFPPGSDIVCFLPHQLCEVDIIHKVLIKKRKLL